MSTKYEYWEEYSEIPIDPAYKYDKQFPEYPEWLKNHYENLYQNSEMVRAINFLFNSCFATDQQIYRYVYRQMEDNKPDDVLNVLFDNDWLERITVDGVNLYKNKEGTQTFSCYPYTRASWRNPRKQNADIMHTFAIASIASQIYGAPEYDALGLGQIFWETVMLPALEDHRVDYIGERRIMERLYGERWFNGKYGSFRKDGWLSPTYPRVNQLELAEKGMERNHYSSQYLDNYLINERSKNLSCYRCDGIIRINGLNPVTIAMEIELASKDRSYYINKFYAYKSDIGQHLYDYVIYYCADDYRLTEMYSALKHVTNNFKDKSYDQIRFVVLNGNHTTLKRFNELQIQSYANMGSYGIYEEESVLSKNTKLMYVPSRTRNQIISKDIPRPSTSKYMYVKYHRDTFIEYMDWLKNIFDINLIAFHPSYWGKDTNYLAVLPSYYEYLELYSDPYKYHLTDEQKQFIISELNKVRNGNVKYGYNEKYFGQYCKTIKEYVKQELEISNQDIRGLDFYANRGMPGRKVPYRPGSHSSQLPAPLLNWIPPVDKDFLGDNLKLFLLRNRQERRLERFANELESMFTEDEANGYSNDTQGFFTAPQMRPNPFR